MTDGVSRGERELQDLEVQWLAVQRVEDKR